jgi:hypothetical protein
MAPDYGLDGRGSIPGKSKIFLFYITSGPALEPTQPPMLRVQGAAIPRVKRPGREAHNSTASSAEINKSGAIPPLPMRIYGVVLN